MAVDSSSDWWSERLKKVEGREDKDPPCILPSRPWESIPSESGPSKIGASISHNSPLYNTSSLSEASLVRLAMNALQGVQSTLISIDKISTVFFSDPADRTFHRIPSLWNRSLSTVALGRILKAIGRSGYIVYQLLQFVDYYTLMRFDHLREQKGSRSDENPKTIEEDREHPQYSLVNQAFAVSVGKILEGYISALDTLYASVGMRRSSKALDVSPHASSEAGLFTSVAHSEVTLLEVYLHTEGLRTQIDALGNICKLHDIDSCLLASSFEDLCSKTKFSDFPIGGNLLTYLYSELKVSDPVHSGLLKFLFIRSFEPYSEFIRSWIYKAEICDPYNEFIVEYPDNLQHYAMGSAGISADFVSATIREQDKVDVPCFLKEFLVPLFRAGQQLQVLMKVLELSNNVGAWDHIYEDFLPSWKGFSSNFLSHSSPLTFNKGVLESMVLSRNNCYRQMMEKLETLSVKLDLRYPQGVLNGIAPTSVNINGGTQSTPVPFALNEDTMTSPSKAIKQDLQVGPHDSKASSLEDEDSSVELPFEFSDCSSLSSSEEQDQLDQLVENTDNFVNVEEKYLSALSFSSGIAQHTPSKVEQLCTMETDCLTSKLKDPRLYFRHPIFSNTSNVDRCPLHLNLDALRSPKISETCDPIKGHDPSFPSAGIPNNSKCIINGNKDEILSHTSGINLEVSVGKNRDADESSSYCSSAMISTNDLEGSSTTDQHSGETCLLPDLSSSESWKVKYDSKFFSANPMLTKQYFAYRISMPGEKGSAKFGKELASFDFTSVKDPFSSPLGKSTTSLGHQIGTKLSTSIDPVTSAFGTTNVRKKETENSDACFVNQTRLSGSNSVLATDARENALQSNVSGGSGWQSLLGSSHNSDTSSGRDLKTGSRGMLDIPLDFVIGKCLLEEILLQYRYVSKLTIKFLEEGFSFQEHLLALRRYHFMELADWADLFIMSLWHHKWYATEADRRISEIQGLLDLSIQKSSCERDKYRDRIYLYIKKVQNTSISASTAGGIQSFNYLGLGYRVDWPVNIILTCGALEMYSEIFSFLIQVKLALSSLAEAWYSLKEHVRAINQNEGSESHESEAVHFKIFMKLRQQVNHFVTTLQQYVQSQLSHVSWCKFLHSLKNKVKDMMDLESVHMSYLNDSLHICFLSDETKGIASIIRSILQCALDFRSCLTGCTWQGGIEDGNSSSKISRMNISQVHNLKNMFHRNIKELYTCYLTSPRHGEFGLSHFWDHLNYNDYYAEVIGKEMVQLAFSI